MNQAIVITSGELLPSLQSRLTEKALTWTCVTPEDFVPDGRPVFPGTLSAEEREKLTEREIRFLDFGGGPGTLIVPGAIKAPSATIGALCLIGLGAVIGENAEIGPGCVIETGAVIGSGARIGAFTTIGTGGIVAKNLTLAPRQRVRPGECVVTDRGLRKVMANGRWIRSEKP